MQRSLFSYLKEVLKLASPNKSKIKTYDNKDDDSKKQLDILSNSLDKNLSKIKAYLSDSDDVIYRDFSLSTSPQLKGSVIYIESLVDRDRLESSVLRPLSVTSPKHMASDHTQVPFSLEALLASTLTNANINYHFSLKQSVSAILAGEGIVIIEGFSKGIEVNISKGPSKTFADPKTEKVVKGPQQGFVEDLAVNMSMIRARLKTPNLVVRSMALGRESNTQIRIVYLKNVADLDIVDELITRLKRIDVDGIVGSSYIEEYINDSPMNLFQTTFYTERPDRIQSMLLEGRIAIVSDGTPFVNVVPAVISDFFITTEDYYVNYYFASFNRLLGYFGAIVVMFLPPFYIAVVTYHQEMIPTALALTIAGTRAGVPYPAFAEALFMEISFEALREAGTRLPTHIGQAVSIVGALIIGQAAVEAGLVSPPVVIVVATTAIFSFTMPYNNLVLSLRLTRFVNMTLAAILGFYGIMTGALMILLTLISLRSFGVPFMTPFAPLNPNNLKDSFLRFPQWALRKRSAHVVKENITKKADNLKPQPPQRKNKEE